MEKEEEKETSWHHANENNSTKFTDCCGLAAEVGGHCPECGKKVT
jgi:hypothetical protein